MSNESEGGGNDPLFERLFAEAEACLDRRGGGKKATERELSAGELDHTVEKKGEEAGEQGLSSRIEAPQRAEPQNHHPSSKAARPEASTVLALSQQLALRVEALKASESRVEKLQSRLDVIKERAKRDQQMALSKRSDQLHLTFLSLMDDLERALGVTVNDTEDTSQFRSYRKGIRSVFEVGLHLLEQQSVTRFNSENEQFDPARHEAVRRESRDDIPPNQIVEVFQAGYMVDGRLLRPARVSVSTQS